MKIHAYECSGGHYLFIPEKNNFSRVPDDVLKKLGGTQSLRHFKTFDLTDNLIGIDGAQAAKDIAAKGFHVNRTIVQINERQQ